MAVCLCLLPRLVRCRCVLQTLDEAECVKIRAVVFVRGLLEVKARRRHA